MFQSSIESAIEKFERDIPCTFVDCGGKVHDGSTFFLKGKVMKIAYQTKLHYGFRYVIFVKYADLGKENTHNEIVSEILNKIVTGSWCLFHYEDCYLTVDEEELLENNIQVHQRVMWAKEDLIEKIKKMNNDGREIDDNY
jgi:hypothetical protein